MSVQFKSIQARSLFQKPEKWSKMVSQEDNLVLLSEFLEKGDCRVLVVYANQQGQLTPSTSFPNTTKMKVSLWGVGMGGGGGGREREMRGREGMGGGGMRRWGGGGGGGGGGGVSVGVPTGVDLP